VDKLQAGKSGNAFRVGDWRVDPSQCQIQLGDRIVKVEPKVMDVLIYFAERPGQVISREELEDNVWRGRVVSYDALTTTIVKLRKAFQIEDSDEPVIKTIPKRGYSLIAPIKIEPESTDQPATPIVAEQLTDTVQSVPVTGSEKSPAVVQQPTSYRLVAAVSILLLLLALLAAWYLFSPRLNISGDIATDNRDYAGTTDIEAQTAFNDGWKKMRENTPASYKAAMALFKRATLLDPDYAHAHAALASVYLNTWQRSWHIVTDTAPLPRTWKLANRSLQNAMKRPTPLAYQVSTEMLIMNRRFDEAIREAHNAIELAPYNPIGHAALAKALLFAGKPQEAQASIDRAMELNPRYPVEFLYILGLIEFNTGQYTKAIAALEQAITGSPQNHIYYIHLIAAYGHLGQYKRSALRLKEANRLRKSCQLPLLTSISAAHFMYNNPWVFKNHEDIVRLQQGLEAAGLPQW
jgi:DNA-binding winged helix-turn-helix (wHTH) protein/tetratricopeptide (TPR) repeat protein